MKTLPRRPRTRRVRRNERRDGRPKSSQIITVIGLACLFVVVWVNISVDNLLETKTGSLPRKLESSTSSTTEAMAGPSLEKEPAFTMPPKIEFTPETKLTGKNYLQFLLRSRPGAKPSKATRDVDLISNDDNNYRPIVTFVDTRPYNGKPKPKTSKYQGIEMSLDAWRTTYMHACGSPSTDKYDILDMAKNFYKPPKTVSQPANRKIEPCQYTFLDLGANVGDSLGKFIDSGWDPCMRPQPIKWTPKYNLTSGVMDSFHDGDNVLVRFGRHFLRKGGRVGPHKSPEDFCYFGLEGNPLFTERLKKLEERVMNTIPRPVKSAHFFTETVAAGANGPTVLFLDTISKDKNFWGSSLLTQPKYVQESAVRDNNGKPIEAKVMGRTLTSLIASTTKRQEGSHLLIKIDIEGGEFPLLMEAHRSGILCDYTARGAIVNILVEKHGPQLAAAGYDMKLWDQFIKDFEGCGVVIQGGGSAG